MTAAAVLRLLDRLLRRDADRVLRGEPVPADGPGDGWPGVTLDLDGPCEVTS